jgi:magnesium transporter
VVWRRPAAPDVQTGYFPGAAAGVSRGICGAGLAGRGIIAPRRPHRLSHRAVLINCVAYHEGRKLADIPREDISDYVARPDHFVWVALAEPTSDELAQMREEFGLHPLAVEDARKGHQRPKIEEYGEMLFVVVHTLEMRQGAVEQGEVAIFAGPNYVLSVRQNTLEGFTQVRERAEREPALMAKGTGFVLYALLDAIVDRYFPVLDALESELELIEERMLVRRASRTTIEALYRLKQKMQPLRHATLQLMEEVARFAGGRSPRATAGLREYYRDVYDHLVRIDQEVDAIREMIATAIQVNLGLVSLTQSEVAKRLAGWAAIIGVPTMIAGVYGMNFRHMPELGWEYGYPLTIAAMVVIDLVLYARLRKAGWL